MCIPIRHRDPRTRAMMVIGNFSLAAAVVVLNLTRHAGSAPHAWLDEISGLLLGLSIGCNLVATRRARRCVS